MLCSIFFSLKSGGGKPIRNPTLNECYSYGVNEIGIIAIFTENDCKFWGFNDVGGSWE